ncbi:MAG TPA: protoporphyrinogen oxidase [Polyangiales bacterium]|nr:protoporphyrinogen oxidase [Polyangiales bacterium]
MRVCVIGGGISGLTAAYRLMQSGAEVELLEGSSRVGGLLGTERVDDTVVETGADSILTEKPWAIALAEELGLRDQVIATRKGPRGSFLVHRGKLVPIPTGFSLIAPADLKALARSSVLSAAGKLRAAAELVVPRASHEDESLEGFVVRRLGRELFDNLAQPLAGGIYGADPSKLSLRATMPRFLDYERDYGSVIRGVRARQSSGATSGARYGLFAAFKGGMQQLIDALEKALAGRIHTRSVVTSLEGDEQGYRVEVRGQVKSYDAIVVALPSHVAARLLRTFDPALSSSLGEIAYGSAATVTLRWKLADIPRRMDAFGFVVPVVEHRGIIASTWASVKYEGRAPDDTALIRVFIGGHRGQHLVEYDDKELLALARRELEALIGVRAQPEWTLVKRYIHAMPQYHLGHLARVAKIEALAEKHERFALAGNAYRGVGIPDAVRSGEEAAKHITASLS